MDEIEKCCFKMWYSHRDLRADDSSALPHTISESFHTTLLSQHYNIPNEIILSSSLRFIKSAGTVQQNGRTYRNVYLFDKHKHRIVYLLAVGAVLKRTSVELNGLFTTLQ